MRQPEARHERAGLPKRKKLVTPALERERRVKGAEHSMARALASGFKAQLALRFAARGGGNRRSPPLPRTRFEGRVDVPRPTADKGRLKRLTERSPNSSGRWNFFPTKRGRLSGISIWYLVVDYVLPTRSHPYPGGGAVL